MDAYRKPYLCLFRAATDALEALERRDLQQAQTILLSAQQQAEELYITWGESCPKP